MKNPVKAYVWQNGMVMTFDEEGQQVPDYQGEQKETLPKLMQDFPDCVVVGAIWGKPVNIVTHPY